MNRIQWAMQAVLGTLKRGNWGALGKSCWAKCMGRERIWAVEIASKGVSKLGKRMEGGERKRR